MKRKLFILTLLLVPIFLNGQGQKQENEISISCGNSVTIYKASDFYTKMAEFWKAHKVDTLNPTIIVGHNYAIINKPAARQDLQEYEKIKTSLWLDSIIISEQQEQLAQKDTLINDLQQRYLGVSNMVVMCEKDRKKEKFARRVFQWSFTGMCVVAFFLGVK